MKIILPVVFLFICFFGCKRNEPINIPNDTTSLNLEQIAVYSTGVPEPSGLAYNSKNNTLFTVSDGNSTVYEIDFTGQILKSMVITSLDLEGIVFSANCDTFYIVDEANHFVAKYLSNGSKISSFQVKVATNLSKSLEGIAIDNNNHLFVLNEKSPCMFLEFIGNTEIFRKEVQFTGDCADIFYENSSDCLWIISDESSCVIKISRTGNLIAKYSLPFTKGEGLAIVGDRIYIVNDSDGKLYVFRKP